MRIILKSIVIVFLVMGCVGQNSHVKTNTSDIFVKLIPGSGSSVQAYISVPQDTQDITVCINNNDINSKLVSLFMRYLST